MRTRSPAARTPAMPVALVPTSTPSRYVPASAPISHAFAPPFVVRGLIAADLPALHSPARADSRRRSPSPGSPGPR
ncbi:hypothetical protein BD626DRAFT_503592 [Schizophyllum amplum]|uniref:Uncharacterized protein n=1 Tax=Schizophyllum amplum TaxID=97359 RepID=A0A550C7E0_9AGAR|nr:hypothetical protein BD626DRAFT_503592 [Auriculariopsis ampla]